MIKKGIYVIFVFGLMVIAAYFLQPVRKGVGFDLTTEYELVKNWPQLPLNFALGNPVGIGIDSSENVITLHRAGREWPYFSSLPQTRIRNKTVLVIDKDNGKLLNSWGENLFIMPHGITIDKENNIWVTDVGLHQVFKFNRDGKVLLQLGEAGVSGNDDSHFNKPTDISVASDGSIYICDGYGNSRIVKFSASGKYLMQWGEKGSGVGEFDIPHGISLANNGKVYVADRQNNRVQIFDSTGRFIRLFEGKNFGAITAVLFDEPTGKIYAVDDVTFLNIKHRGSDIYIFDSTGTVQTRFGRSGLYKGSLSWYHDLAVDKESTIYVADLLGNTIQKFKQVPK